METLSEPRNRPIYDFLFSWSIAFSVSYSLLIYAFQMPTTSETGTSDSGGDFCYYYFRAAARFIDALHLLGVSPVSTAVLARQDDHWSQFGRELTFLTSGLCLTFVIVFILKLTRRTRVDSVVMDRLFGAATLFAAPVCYAAALSLPRKFSDNALILGDTRIPAWLTVLLTEFVILIALLLRSQDSRKLAWIAPALLTIHFLVWVSILGQPIFINSHGPKGHQGLLTCKAQ